MRYAVAMYRAGFQVDANDCNYDSFKELGLLCPFCKEAVYWSRGSEYVREGQKLSARARFSHYGSDDPTAQQCELRAKRKEGREYLKQLEIESKNQRLKLFNDYFWEMLQSQRPIPIPREKLLRNKKWFGAKRLTEFSRITAKRWKKREVEGLNYELVAKTFEVVNQHKNSTSAEEQRMLVDFKKTHKKLEEIESYRAFVAKETQRQADWTSDLDQQLHLAICKEICSFLGTRTAGYALEKMCLSYVNVIRVSYPQIQPDEVLSNYDLFFGGLMRGFGTLVARAHWLEEIRGRGDWLATGFAA